MKCEILLDKINHPESIVYIIGMAAEESMIGKYAAPIAAVEVSRNDNSITLVCLPDINGRPVKYNCTEEEKAEIKQFIQSNPKAELPLKEVFGELFEDVLKGITNGAINSCVKVLEIQFQPQPKGGNYKFSAGEVLASEGFHKVFGDLASPIISGIMEALRRSVQRGLYFEQHLVVDGQKVVAWDEIKHVKLFLEEELPTVTVAAGNGYVN